MNHWLVAPVLLPAFTAVGLLLTARAPQRAHRAISLVSALAQLILAISLAYSASSEARQIYLFGAWPVPLGIAFVLDRLSALMLVLLHLVALPALLYSARGWDTRGRNFHALFHFQLMGLSGAFLTGDIFNLFVFFEVLLIASYGLLLHGGGPERVRASLHYVGLNLVGSALFLFGLGLIYGTLGTLNFAHLAERVAALPDADLPLVRAAGGLLLTVFGLKAAALPLYFWLPPAYASASPPVAALFAIMTKVGLYSIIRLSFVVFGLEGPLQHLTVPWLAPLGLTTLLAGSLGALAAPSVRRLVAWLTIASVGLILTALSTPTPTSLAAALYYMIHSTIMVAAFFLLADLIATRRGAHQDTLPTRAQLSLWEHPPGALGAVFLVLAILASGLPPLSGFFGKAFVLSAALDGQQPAATLTIALAGSLCALVALSRAGTGLFWRRPETSSEPAQQPFVEGATKLEWTQAAPVALLVALSIALVVAGGPMRAWLGAAAAQTFNAASYTQQVLAPHPAAKE